MNNGYLRIEQFESILYARDMKGRISTFPHRYASCFIITLQGKIKFTFDNGYIITDSKHGIFIPEGAKYVNECLESAESIVFNFHALEPIPSQQVLKPMDKVLVMRFYDSMNQISSAQYENKHYYMLSQLYLLAQELFQTDAPRSQKEMLAEKGYSYLRKEASRSSLQIPQAAEHCHISTVYLRKIFNQIYGKSPFDVLTDIRMKKANEMLLEKLPVKEIAFSVGYSDVYQFSRAYKRYFGHAPTVSA